MVLTKKTSHYGPLWAISDQAFVSGTNFLTSIIIGNACGAEGLGLYALGATILIFSTTVQSALIHTPLAIRLNRLSERRQRIRLGSSLIHVFIQVGLIVTLVGGVSLFLQGKADSEIGKIGSVLAITVPFVLVREFSRRVCYCRFDLLAVNILDAIVSAIQLGTLLWLWRIGELTPHRAFTVIALACSLSAVGFLLIRRQVFGVRISALRRDLGWDLRIGSWILLEQIFTFFAVYALPWLIALMTNEVQVGIFAACVALSGIANPFWMGLGNYLLPRISLSLQEGNRRDINSQIFRYQSMILIGSMVLVAICWLFGDQLVSMLFSRTDFTGQGWLITVLSFRMLLGSAGLTSHFALLAVNRPLYSFWASVISVGLSCLLAAILIPHSGLIGVATAWVIGTGFESMFLILSARIELRRYFRNAK